MPSKCQFCDAYAFVVKTFDIGDGKTSTWRMCDEHALKNEKFVVQSDRKEGGS